MDRIPYHLFDGVTLEVRDGTGTPESAITASATELTSTPSDLALANNESEDFWLGGVLDPGGTGDVCAWVLTLPEPHTIDGFFTAIAGELWSNFSRNEVWYRPDGGMWTKWYDLTSMYASDAASWATGIITSPTVSPINDVVQIAVTAASNGPALTLVALHVYGQPTDTTDRLRLWDPSLDQAHAGLDFGSVNPSEVKTVQFRIKNTDDVKTAGGIVLSAGDLTGDMADGVAFSADDTTYTATLDIGALAPGAISSVLYARRTVAAEPTFGHQQAYLSALPTTWS